MTSLTTATVSGAFRELSRLRHATMALSRSGRSTGKLMCDLNIRRSQYLTVGVGVRDRIRGGIRVSVIIRVRVRVTVRVRVGVGVGNIWG